MADFLIAIVLGSGIVVGFVCGVFLCTYYHNKLVQVRLDTFVKNLNVIFADLVIQIDESMKRAFAPCKMTTKPPAQAIPPPHVMKMLEKMSGISSEIQDLVMTLDGPLRGALDAKQRQANAGKARALQDEMKEIIQEVLRLGFDPRIMFMDAYGNKQITNLSKLVDRMTNGPEDLKPFSDDKPNLSIIDEEMPPVVPTQDNNAH